MDFSDHFGHAALFVWPTLLATGRGLRAQRARQAATLDDAYASLDRLRDRNDRHDEETQQLRVLLLEETQRYRLQLLETRHERDLLLGERRAANVMAIMMESQLRQLTFMTGRIDRLRSLIINHQPPCPLGGFNFSSGECGRC